MTVMVTTGQGGQDSNLSLDGETGDPYRDIFWFIPVKWRPSNCSVFILGLIGPQGPKR